MRPGDFAAYAFEWLRERIAFDQGFFVASLKGEPTWLDAHFCGVADPRALMESYAKVRHLDVISTRMLSHPFHAYRIDVDHPEIAGRRFAPFREHLVRFRGLHIVNIAIPISEGPVSWVILLAREEAGRRFKDNESELFEALAPHLAESAVINRLLWPPFGGAPSADALPLALLGPDGRFMQMTSEFARLLWPETPPNSAYLPEPMFARLRKGQVLQLPDGKHSLCGQADATGGWRLRIRSSGPLDRLTQRELQVAELFARGVNHKVIAEQLGLTPATVRNHLRNLYEKLEVHDRDALVALLGSSA